MKISSTHISPNRPLPALKKAETKSTGVLGTNTQDQVELSAPQNQRSSSETFVKVAKHAGRFLGNTLLAALPAVATSVAMVAGGPNAAGLALAGSIVGGGAASVLLNSSEMGARDAFTVGGTAALLGAGAGMIAGPAGIALSAGMGAVWTGVRQIGEAIHSR